MDRDWRPCDFKKFVNYFNFLNFNDIIILSYKLKYVTAVCYELDSMINFFDFVYFDICFLIRNVQFSAPDLQ